MGRVLREPRFPAEGIKEWGRGWSARADGVRSTQNRSDLNYANLASLGSLVQIRAFPVLLLAELLAAKMGPRGFEPRSTAPKAARIPSYPTVPCPRFASLR